MHTPPADRRANPSGASSSAAASVPSEASKPPTRRKWLKRLGWGGAVVLGLVVAAAFVGNWWAGSQRAALLDRMDALGVPSSLGPAESAAGAVEETEGSAGKTLLDWTAEAKAAQPSDEVVDRLPARGTVYVVEARMAMPEPMVEALRAMRPAVATVYDGLESGAVWFANRHGVNAFAEMETVLALSGNARWAARVLYEEMWRAMHAGDAAAVDRAALGIEALAESLRGGLLVESLVEMSIRALAAGAFESVLSRGELPAAMLLRTADRYEVWAEAVSPTDLLAGELAYTRSIVESGDGYLKDVHERRVAEGSATPWSGPAKAVRSVTSALFPEVKAFGLVWMAEGTLATYESAAEAESKGRPALLAWSQEEAGDDERLSGDGLRSPVKNLALTADRLLVAAAALRAEAWRVEHGGWPADLAVVHGGKTPTDWAGRPLVYRVQGGDAVVYGVGLNGVDDGGLDRRVDEPDAPETADDVAKFWLYAVGERGALPAPGPWDETP